MKSLPFLFILTIVLIISNTSCTKDDYEEKVFNSEPTNHVTTNQTATSRDSRSLSDILQSGAYSVEDLDVLRENDVYPFDALSETEFNNFKNAARFYNNVYLGSTYGLYSVLSENQYKILLQIVHHRNVTIDNEQHVTFETGGTETPYSDVQGYNGVISHLGYYPDVIVTDPEDCWTGFGDCVILF